MRLMEHNGSTSFVLTMTGGILSSLLLGSFLYTWSAENQNVQEKVQWRDKHETKHEKEINELKTNQKETSEKIDRQHDETQKTLQTILLETQSLKRQNERR